MIRKTNAQKILEVLAVRPGLDDDGLSQATGVAPRETVNQECRLLQSRGLVLRETGPRGKIVNYLSTAPDGERASEKRQFSAPGSRPAPDMSQNLSTREGVAIKTHPAQKLFIIPCSKKKNHTLARSKKVHQYSTNCPRTWLTNWMRREKPTTPEHIFPKQRWSQHGNATMERCMCLSGKALRTRLPKVGTS